MEMESEKRSGRNLTGTWTVVLSVLAAASFVASLVMVAACNRGDGTADVAENDGLASEPRAAGSEKIDAPPLPTGSTYEVFERWDDRVGAYEDLLAQGQSEQTAIVDVFGPRAEKPEGAEYLFEYSVFDCNNIWVLVDFIDDGDYEGNVQLVKDFLAAGAAPWPENDDPDWQITEEHGRVRAAIPITLLRSLSQRPEVEEIYFPVPTSFAIPV